MSSFPFPAVTSILFVTSSTNRKPVIVNPGPNVLIIVGDVINVEQQRLSFTIQRDPLAALYEIGL